jgi:ribonuclease P protein component
MVLFAAANGEDRIRVGISVSKRVGGAVVRNKVKRRIRECVRLRLEGLLPGWDLLFIVRPAAAQASNEEVSKAVERLVALAGVVAKEPCSVSFKG